MNRRLICGTFLLAFLVSLTLLVSAQTVEDHLRQGDEYYAQFDDARALEAYLLAVQADPGNYDALWKTARAYIDVADLKNPEEAKATEEQKKMYMEARSYAKKAVEANPNDTWGHFFLSAAMGKYALSLSKKEQIDMSKSIKAEIDKAIELDETNDSAYHALGRWHRRMAEIGGMKRFFGGIIYGSIPKGSFEESEKYLQKAVELKPDYTNHYLELGRTYIALKKNDQAKEAFQKCLEAPITTSKCELYKKEAQKELEGLKK